ncbi:unnamed protein product [Leptidea sinapis]|uniref:Uncharacterized protein n=1 Tax=Leptidea sinapis TaxID=189913 RepID=A0A5E4Q304_9NEOP|nr:unnamed protein product [Leptidea sinapis]
MKRGSKCETAEELMTLLLQALTFISSGKIRPFQQVSSVKTRVETVSWSLANIQSPEESSLKSASGFVPCRPGGGGQNHVGIHQDHIR